MLRGKRRPEQGLPAFAAHQSGGRAESRVALVLTTEAVCYRAGELLTGTLELTVRAEDVWLGELALEFSGSEGKLVFPPARGAADPGLQSSGPEITPPPSRSTPRRPRCFSP